MGFCGDPDFRFPSPLEEGFFAEKIGAVRSKSVDKDWIWKVFAPLICVGSGQKPSLLRCRHRQFDKLIDVFVGVLLPV
jgi:hypothetical protein